MSLQRFLLVCALLALFTAVDGRRKKIKRKGHRGDGGAAPRATKQKKKNQKEVLNVLRRGLISKAPKAMDIVKNHKLYSKHTQAKYFKHPSLAYVTPWNRHGYTVTKTFTGKFTHVAPVWYQIRPGRKKTRRPEVSITGGHDVDKRWVDEMQSKGAKVVPRFILEFNVETLVKLAGRKAFQYRVVDAVVKEVEARGFDGIVLEMSHSWAQVAQSRPKRRRKLNSFVRRMGKALHKRSLTLVLVVPPPGRQQGSFGYKDFKQVLPYVDLFSVMTYDHSGGGGVAPLPWMEASIRTLAGELLKKPEVAKKILLGLNFYGYQLSKANTKAIVGHEYIELLRKYKPRLYWNAKSAEHVISLNMFDAEGKREQTNVLYPTLQSILDRVQLAVNLKVGVAIWEVGQGLDYFYDLL